MTREGCEASAMEALGIINELIENGGLEQEQIQKLANNWAQFYNFVAAECNFKTRKVIRMIDEDTKLIDHLSTEGMIMMEDPDGSS